MAWLTRVNERYDDRPDVDRNKLEKHKYIWGTRVPKHNTLDKENSNQGDGDDDDDYVLAKLDYLRQELDDGASAQEGGQNLGSDVGDSSWPTNFAGCDICQYRGFIAFHLRHSEGCLRQLRARPQLR